MCAPPRSHMRRLTSGKPRATCLNQVREQQRQNAGGICCGGKETSSRAAANHRAEQVRAQAGPDGPLLALGGTAWWGFSWELNGAGVKVRQAAGNHRNETEETRGFRLIARRSVEIQRRQKRFSQRGETMATATAPLVFVFGQR